MQLQDLSTRCQPGSLNTPNLLVHALSVCAHLRAYIKHQNMHFTSNDGIEGEDVALRLGLELGWS